MNFYVYILSRPDKVDPFNPSLACPFYVGKGCNGRIGEHRREAKRLKNYLGHKSIKINIIHNLWERNLDFEEEIIIKDLTEEKAMELECLTIKTYGRIDNGTGVLSNLTDGGEGIVGLSIQYAKQQWESEDHRKLMSEKMKGNQNATGKPKSEEHKRKISEANKGKPKSEEHKRNMMGNQNGLGTRRSDETKKKMSESAKIARKKYLERKHQAS